MEVRVFELAGGKFSVRELIWNDEVKAHFRVINDKAGRSEVAEFQVSTKQRFNRPSALDELISYLKDIQKRADDRQPQDASSEGAAHEWQPTSYSNQPYRQSYGGRERQSYGGRERGTYQSRGPSRDRPQNQDHSHNRNQDDEPNFNQ